MLNNFETNEFHGDSDCSAKSFKCFTFEEGRKENKAVKWNI